jgi:chemosensory pili system protein ChpB (putative protein-glutamate methylesterase)
MDRVVMDGVTPATGVAIVSNSPLQRRRLQDAIGKFGLEAPFTGDPQRLMSLGCVPEVRLWLVTLEDEADHPSLFDHLLENTDAPILFGLDEAPRPGTTDYFSWERRLVDKLERQLGHLEQLDGQGSLEALDAGPELTATLERPQWIPPARADMPAQQVWVLGASLGGPAAIKAFLDHLPPDLPVGFVYAQHIDNNFIDVLARVLGRHASYKLRHAEPGYRVRNTDVVLMPVDREWTVDATGCLQPGHRPWPGPYGPSIDQVLLNLWAHYRQRCHAVLFSGMGNDGAIAAPQLSQQGSQIWVQSSDSCGNSSMPESVTETGCVSFTGNPVELAAKLVKTIAETCLLERRQHRDSA